MHLSGDNLRRYGWPRQKGVAHGFREALRTGKTKTAGANVEVLSEWETQTCQGPVAARRRAVAERGVVHVVGRRLKGNASELWTRSAAGPSDGALRWKSGVVWRNSQVLERGRAIA